MNTSDEATSPDGAWRRPVATCASAGTRIISVRVGRLDKFQGQEGAGRRRLARQLERRGRGISFLFDHHGVNVATSRAQCRVVLVWSPRLLEVDCKTIDHMRLANALCCFSSWL